MSLFAYMECSRLTQSSSTFASLLIWADRQLVCDFADATVSVPCMLCLRSCHVQLALCAFLLVICFPCHDLHRSECIELVFMPSWVIFQRVSVFTKSENWLCSSYVRELGRVFCEPFWPQVTLGVLLSLLSSSMPCSYLSCSGFLSCCFAAPKRASWSEISD